MGCDSAAGGKSIRMHLGTQEVDLDAGKHWGRIHLGANKNLSGLSNSSAFDEKKENSLPTLHPVSSVHES